MSFEAAQIAIESRLAANFTAYPIKWQNVVFDEETESIFVDLQVKEHDSERASLGPNPLHRSLGIISINVYVPENSGTATGRGIADDLAAIFRDASFSGIICRSPVVRNIGSYEGHYVINMSVPFHRDEQF